MSKAHAMAFALQAIVTLASCATSSRPAETRTEPARVVDPSAGTIAYAEFTSLWGLGKALVDSGMVQ